MSESILIMMLPKWHGSLLQCGVEVMRLMGTKSQVYWREVSKIHRSLQPGCSKMCCGMMKRLGMNRASQWGSGMMKLFLSSLFMVSMTCGSLAMMEGWFRSHQCNRALARVEPLMNFAWQPIVMTRM